MSKVTSKFQLTLPRKIARAHKIGPGTELSFVSSGETIRLVVERSSRPEPGPGKSALESYDAATLRQVDRNRPVLAKFPSPSTDRGWSREDLYEGRIVRGE